jgi:hypothetical protein
MTVTELRKILRELYGARRYRITSTGEIHVYGQMPNSDIIGWRYAGAVGDHATEQHLRYLSGEDAA